MEMLTQDVVAFEVHDGNPRPRERNGVVVFAHDGEEARRLAAHFLGSEEDAEAVRAPRWDARRLGADSGVLRPEDDPELFRTMGWSLADDERCVACNLATFGDLEPLCRVCEECGDCHPDEGCEDVHHGPERA
mgnify:CR=1 FL=1